jgi:hypothetical protein
MFQGCVKKEREGEGGREGEREKEKKKRKRRPNVIFKFLLNLLIFLTNSF